jgi:ribonuclease E
MANKMLIDSSHPEETRVVVLRGNRVEEFDFESASKKQLRGNIYLAKVTRVEPSLQAAFVEYGGNRHGFLAFSEIHPDYYLIPVADRQALLAEEALHHEEEEDEPRDNGRRSRRNKRPESRAARTIDGETVLTETIDEAEAHSNQEFAPESDPRIEGRDDNHYEDHHGGIVTLGGNGDDSEDGNTHRRARKPSEGHEAPPAVENIGGDAMEELPRRISRSRKQYKIQEVIKRRQILLIQVVKEERGNKGAALTTYLSLAGRYSVLMPNTARGGGISRKITQATDRQRLKSVVQEMEVPEGMGVILRTAGASRTKAEIKRDFEYLMRMWENVRELTLQSTAPCLVYEEGSLIKRAIRDLYNKDIDDVLVAGENGYREAKEFMRLLMPSHAKNVKPYRDAQPLFARSGVETQLDAMFSNQVTLKSGGYIVINQTEALVAIDVNSGRSTREHNIEDTALRTNLEAADEVARQLRLRDLAGLIVVDFIDMEETRNNRAVERRMKEALKNDRARIQVGHISHFGLLEMSRQRMRTGVLEGSTVICPHCAGAGMVRSTSSISLHVLRGLEDALIKSAQFNMIVRTRTEVALYILNQKRPHLLELEQRFGISITVMADESMAGSLYHSIERGEMVENPLPAPLPATSQRMEITPTAEDEVDEFIEDEVELDEETEEQTQTLSSQQPKREVAQAEGENGESDAVRRKRRRRRRRGRGADRESSGINANAPQPSDEGMAEIVNISQAEAERVTLDETGTSAKPAEIVESEPTPAKPKARRSRRNANQANDETLTSTESPKVESVAVLESEVPMAKPVRKRAPARSRDSKAVVTVPVVEESIVIPAIEPIAESQPETKQASVLSAPAAFIGEDAKLAQKPTTVIESTVIDPNRPKRGGWWQRAKDTLTGNS